MPIVKQTCDSCYKTRILGDLFWKKTSLNMWHILNKLNSKKSAGNVHTTY